MTIRYSPILIVCAVLLLVSGLHAQERLPVRQYTAPEELISMDAVTTFDKAIDIFNTASKRFQSKPIIYDGATKNSIGINITHMHWQDAFELVLRAQGHWYEENPDFVRVYDMKKTSKGGGRSDTAKVKAEEAMQTREVQISAVFFEANRTELERLGLDWLLTHQTPTNTVQQLMSTSGTTTFEADEEGSEGKTEIEVGSITTLAFGQGAIEVLAALKALQSENLGELISSPNITVRSGEKGRIQVGQDFSVKMKDFAGNTTEQFFSTGTIIEVVPTVLQKDSLEFVNLEIAAERSTAQPDPVSTIINKTLATTSVILIDGEETVVGGLVTNEMRKVRRGVPFLKDLPWWVFGLRYIFGYQEDQWDKKELIILLKATIVPSVEKRVAQKLQEIKSGQNALLRESQRLETLRLDLVRQIEQAKERSDVE
ncbi:MAG: type II and III secretion system protein [Bacteroidetes bacterium]|nr:type II and III secretion system protein [Bacteroidota bacterium]